MTNLAEKYDQVWETMTWIGDPEWARRVEEFEAEAEALIPEFMLPSSKWVGVDAGDDPDGAFLMYDDTEETWQTGTEWEFVLAWARIDTDWVRVATTETTWVCGWDGDDHEARIIGKVCHPDQGCLMLTEHVEEGRRVQQVVGE